MTADPQTSEAPQEWVSVAEAARRLDCDRNVLYRLIRKNKVVSRNIGQRRTEVLAADEHGRATLDLDRWPRRVEVRADGHDPTHWYPMYDQHRTSPARIRLTPDGQ